MLLASELGLISSHWRGRRWLTRRYRLWPWHDIGPLDFGFSAASSFLSSGLPVRLPLPFLVSLCGGK